MFALRRGLTFLCDLDGDCSLNSGLGAEFPFMGCVATCTKNKQAEESARPRGGR